MASGTDYPSTGTCFPPTAPPYADVEHLQNFILWAREQGIVLQQFNIGSIGVTLYDPKASAVALSPSGPALGDEDRDEEDDGQQKSPLPAHYAEMAKSYGIEVPNG